MNLEDVYKLLTNFHQDFKSFKQDIMEFKQDMLEFKQEMYAFRQDMYMFKADMYAFKEEMYEFKKFTISELSKHSQALVSIENTMKFYGDMYKLNRDEISAINKRVAVLEST